jgi:uncharacterized protein
MQSYHKLYTLNYFWRTVQKQEIDFIEERGGRIAAFEFKWNRRKKDKINQSFIDEYQATGEIIDKENFRSFVRFVKEDL